MTEYLENDEINEWLTDWSLANMSRIDSFKMKEYEKIFACIYSFEFVLIQIDEYISKQENKNPPKPLEIELNGQQVILCTEKKSKAEFTSKWKLLNDIGLNSAERKELNIQYEDYLKLKYARYMGFIEGVLRMFGVPF